MTIRIQHDFCLLAAETEHCLSSLCKLFTTERRSPRYLAHTRIFSYKTDAPFLASRGSDDDFFAVAAAGLSEQCDGEKLDVPSMMISQGPQALRYHVLLRIFWQRHVLFSKRETSWPSIYERFKSDRAVRDSDKVFALQAVSFIEQFANQEPATGDVVRV